MTNPQSIENIGQAYKKIRAELGKVIVGQDEVVEQLLTAIFAGGHCILEGVPGLAKTLLISSLAQTLSLKFRRIQFTPDLMPSDITGTEIIQENRSTGAREFRFLSGPIFANIILADEINRTGPKTQAALLEAMQEKQVTVSGNLHKLDLPFFVLATQNPIEQEGTYPLPEAQQDRFMFKVLVGYPTAEEELNIVRSTTSGSSATLQSVLGGEEILAMQKAIRELTVSDEVVRYATDIVRSTRVSTPDADKGLREWVTWGAGPRASQFLVLAAKTRAALQGRVHVGVADVAASAIPVLRHRIVLNFAAESEGMTPDRVLADLLKSRGAHPSAVADKAENF
ncbi:MAG: AAA family ATPase [Planctomycetota bacterium]